MSTPYADVLLPLAAPQAFTYSVPAGVELAEGMRVRVPLGKRKICEGVVVRLHDTAPRNPNRVKAIVEVLDTEPFVRPEQRRLWSWMAGYYLCTEGEVMKAGLPAGIRNGSYHPPTELFVRLTESYRSPQRIQEALESMQRAKTQSKALLTYLSRLPQDAQGEPCIETLTEEALWVLRNDLTGQVPASALLKLVERGILVQAERIPSAASRRSGSAPFNEAAIPRSPYAEQVWQAFESHPTVLLSGEVADARRTTLPLYGSLIAREMAAGRQTLLLLPDTVLTTQVTNELQNRFGSRCLFYHARVSVRARGAAYQRMVEAPEEVGLIVGTRSSLFLPFQRLGLVIVDNEHDPNYRQSDPAPRYHARDTALVLADLHGARALLSSPTPSTESWLNAQPEGGKYGSVTVPTPCDVRRPNVMVLERGKGLLSKYLQRRIGETLEEGRQVVLFQNRRGFSPYVECGNCGTTPTCPHCNVTLTYHKEHAALECHYCGWAQPYSLRCPSCEMQAMVPRGIGTERIEELVAELFPEVKIARMDTDTTRGAGALSRMMTELSEGETGILVGTQMVTRTAQAGENIGLVGVINADNMLSSPEFRSAERAYQLLMQLKALLPDDGSGEMVIQSSQRLHPVLVAVSNHELASFYAAQLQERQAVGYPPYVRMLRLTFLHSTKQQAAAAAACCEALLRERFGRRVSPPFEPQVDRVQNRFIFHLLLRIERQRPVARAKALMLETVAAVRKQYPSVHITAEADPL